MHDPYTLDGSAPRSRLRCTPAILDLEYGAGSRAGVCAGLLPGPLHSESFVLLNPNVIHFSSDLPVIVIHNFGAARPCQRPSW